MRHQCIKCGKLWGKRQKGEDVSISSGLCKKCLKECITPLYRKRQLRENNFDCFGKSSGYCDQKMCSYRLLCLDSTSDIQLNLSLEK